MILLSLAGIKCANIQTYFKAIHLIVQCGEPRVSILEAELKMHGSQIVNK